MKKYTILLILIVSSPTFAADKVLECKFYNSFLASSCPGIKETNIVQIVLNTNDFLKSSSNAEYTHMDCSSGYVAKTTRVPMEVTPTTLSFSIDRKDGYGISYWNIDRKTLKAGWKESRKATCTISDLDTSANQI